MNYCNFLGKKLRLLGEFGSYLRIIKKKQLSKKKEIIYY